MKRAVVLGACAFAAAGLSGCGRSPANPVLPLTPATYVYAFEPGRVFAYGLTEAGGINAIAGVRFRAADNGWGSVAADPFARRLFGLALDGQELWSFALDAAGGTPSLIEDAPRRPPSGWETTAVAVAPSGRFLFSCIDPAGQQSAGRVAVFDLEADTGVMAEVAGSPFATQVGPHRLWPDPRGRFLYVSDAVKRPDGPSCLSGFRLDPTSGVLTRTDGSPYKTIAFINQVEYHPAGTLLFVTAGHYILVYRLHGDGSIEALPGPSEPVFDPTGSYVFSLVASRDGRFLFAFQQSGWILSYAVDEASGALRFVGELRGAAGFVGWLLHPDGELAFALGSAPPTIHAHRLDAERGLLTVASAPLALEPELTPYTKGRALFFDATARTLGVLLRRGVGAEAQVELHTFAIDSASGALTRVAVARLGETGTPFVVPVRFAPTWVP